MQFFDRRMFNFDAALEEAAMKRRVLLSYMA